MIHKSVETLLVELDALRLVDHHVHGAIMDELDDTAFEVGCSESPWLPPVGTTHLDSQLGFAIRRWCAPVLDLPPHASSDDYLARRRECGARELTRRLLVASGVGCYLVDTGYQAEQILEPTEMAAISGATAMEIVRLESVAEQVAATGVAAAQFADRFDDALFERSKRAVGLKSVIAYRYGLDFDPEPPSPVEVRQASARRSQRPAAWLIRCCCAICCGWVWNAGCRCSSTSGMGILT